MPGRRQLTNAGALLKPAGHITNQGTKVDNLKSAVLKRLVGAAPVFNPKYLDRTKNSVPPWKMLRAIWLVKPRLMLFLMQWCGPGEPRDLPKNFLEAGQGSGRSPAAPIGARRALRFSTSSARRYRNPAPLVYRPAPGTAGCAALAILPLRP